MQDKNIELLRQWIDESDNIVFFGGAGVSTESGIPDFRSADGLYTQKGQFPPEEIISHSFFLRYPEEFYRFYRDKMVYPDAHPNAAHLFLAELEKKGKLRCVITQNIDGLHQLAGSRKVCELHGSIHRNHCMKCGRAWSLADIMAAGPIPRCECGGIIKPDVVLYEEPLPGDVFSEAIRAIRNCDVFIIGGTSLSVWPAAGLLEYASTDKICLINRDATSMDYLAKCIIRGSIGEIFSRLSQETRE